VSDDQRPGDSPEDGEEERPPEPAQPPEGASAPTPADDAPPPEDDAPAPAEDAPPAGEPSGDAPAEDDESAEDEAEEAEDEAEAEQPAREEDQAPGAIAPADRVLPQRPVVRPMPRTAVPIGAAAISEEELENKTPSLWWRFLAGSVVIVMSVAAAVSVVGLLFLSDVAAKLQPIPGIQAQLTAYESGEAQTILIIGSDYREGDPKENARSDTTMLLRVDPDNKVLSLFSLPRDLKVFIPGYGEGRLNEAYTLGGEKKTLKTVKAFTGLDINVVVEINFNGFADAVTAIDCVYIDVDRDYFNDNSDGGDDYAAIDINSGYQRLCGEKALQYVRYRHTDTDLVRAARQQDFLREARQKVEPRELLGAVIGVGTGSELIDIFTQYTRSSIDDEAQIIDVLKSFIAVQSAPVNEVHFEGDIGDATNTYVTSTDEQVKTAIDEFLNGVGSEGQRGGEQASAKPEEEREDKPKEDKPKPKPEDLADGAAVVGTDALADVQPGGIPGRFPTMGEHLAADAKKNQRRLPIPVFYPTAVMPGSAFDTGSRTYEYENEDNKKEDAYKTVIAWTTPSTLTEYYGVMGTTWDDPPILRNPSETREIDGRDYMLFYDGDRLRMVGWREAGASYWLNNTLSQSIPEAEMLAIATSMKQA
jgi:LCP family protein required for cell wall assembly